MFVKQLLEGPQADKYWNRIIITIIINVDWGARGVAVIVENSGAKPDWDYLHFTSQ